ncbi:putative galactinol--sucrose galactosyltransferase 6 [Nymphaea thermarum]|nr:putative galactinol--sucrose galactosyltransferase 6 [Nymphaea thermarum]
MRTGMGCRQYWLSSSLNSSSPPSLLLPSSSAFPFFTRSSVHTTVSPSEVLSLYRPMRQRVLLRLRALSTRQASAFVGKGKKESKEGDRKGMTITPMVRVSERKLFVGDRAILSDVQENVISSSASDSGPIDGIFVGANLKESNSRHVVPLGTLRNVRFVASFRFKLWWMAQKMGDRGQDVPTETQFLLVESRDDSSADEFPGLAGHSQTFYTVFLPLLEGPFRASLQGNSLDQLEICIESGDPAIRESAFSHSLYVAAGSDPFSTISDAIRAVKNHLKSFRQRSEKRLPGIVDWFGWCTWDAFYQEVTAEGVEAGLASLAAGGAPAKFVIIDDGWQSVGSDPGATKESELFRLTGIKENHKFQRKSGAGDGSIEGINHIVDIAKAKHGLKYVYVWHAITGYWGGVQPGVAGMEQYNSAMKYPSHSPGVVSNDPAMKTDILTKQGLGVVHPQSVYRFYDELHSYLASAGVDGVKVDVQCILETLGAGLGGRVELTSKYHRALDASIARNFPDNGCIACMSHNTDALYWYVLSLSVIDPVFVLLCPFMRMNLNWSRWRCSSKQTAVVRASDDFYPRDPVSHTIHIASVAYNSIFLGEFMQPDWDMFHSLHPAAEYHAAARAISGGPIYVSDAPGKHNFELLRKLVLRDGSILRARLPGRPTCDSLFADPARDGMSLLKIWNMNKFTGVLGVFNCQGAAWSSTEKKNVFHENSTKTLTGSLRGRDVHLISEAAIDADWNGDCVVYSHKGELVRLPNNASLPLTLGVLEHEVFTITPVKFLGPGFGFAPLGLIDMINAGGAIESYEVQSMRKEIPDAVDEMDSLLSRATLENCSREAIACVKMEVKGCGRFGAYSSSKPRRCLVNNTEVEFSYDSATGLVTLQLLMAHSSPLQAVTVEV